MNKSRLENLTRAARFLPEDQRVPLAFEKRIMARVVDLAKKADPWTVWNAALWRAALASIAVTLCLGAWANFSRSEQAPELAGALEQVVLAPIQSEGEIW